MTHEKRRYSAEDKLIENGGFSYKDDTQSLRAERDRLRKLMGEILNECEHPDWASTRSIADIARKALEGATHGN